MGVAIRSRINFRTKTKMRSIRKAFPVHFKETQGCQQLHVTFPLAIQKQGKSMRRPHWGGGLVYGNGQVGGWVGWGWARTTNPDPVQSNPRPQPSPQPLTQTSPTLGWPCLVWGTILHPPPHRRGRDPAGGGVGRGSTAEGTERGAGVGRRGGRESQRGKLRIQRGDRWVRW